MSMLDVIFLRHGIMTSQWKASHLVMFLRHGIMTSQSKAFHLVNAHLTVSNLSALSNQNTRYKTIALESNFNERTSILRVLHSNT